MTAKEFWSTTPRKFFALLRMHNRANDPEVAKEAEKKKPSASNQLSLQEAMAWKRRK